MALSLFNLVKQDLRFDEGRFSEVTADSKIKDKNGKIIPKFSIGVGHQVLPEDNLKPGDTISAEQEEIFFNKDVRKSITAARRAMPGFDDLPFNFQRGMVNFMFQLGGNADKEFPNAFAAINRGDLAGGIRELSTVGNGSDKPSKWLANDTPKRAARTIAKLQQGLDEQFDIVRPDTPARIEGTYEKKSPTPYPDDPGITFPGLGLNPQLPEQPFAQPAYAPMENYGDVGAPPVAQFQPDLALHNGIFDPINIPPPEFGQPAAAQLTPFEAEMQMRQAFDANKVPPPTMSPTPYMQNGRIMDGRMFISGPNQPEGPARVVNDRRR